MKVESKTPVMLMSVKSREYEGKVYYSADLYDMEQGAIYNCNVSAEAFNTLSPVQKPAALKGVILNIGSQYQNRSRLELIGWS